MELADRSQNPSRDKADQGAGGQTSATDVASARRADFAGSVQRQDKKAATTPTLGLGSTIETQSAGKDVRASSNDASVLLQHLSRQFGEGNHEALQTSTQKHAQ